MSQRVRRVQQPIAGRRRAQIHALIRPRGDDLTGRLLGKLGLVDQGQERLALVLAQAVSGGSPRGSRGAASGLAARHRPPRARGHPQAATGARQARPGGASCVDEWVPVMPLLQVDQASAGPIKRCRTFLGSMSKAAASARAGS